MPSPFLHLPPLSPLLLSSPTDRASSLVRLFSPLFGFPFLSSQTNLVSSLTRLLYSLPIPFPMPSSSFYPLLSFIHPYWSLPLSHQIALQPAFALPSLYPPQRHFHPNFTAFHAIPLWFRTAKCWDIKSVFFWVYKQSKECWVSKWESGASEKVNSQVSDPVLMSRFFRWTNVHPSPALLPFFCLSSSSVSDSLNLNEVMSKSFFSISLLSFFFFSWEGPLLNAERKTYKLSQDHAAEIVAVVIVCSVVIAQAALVVCRVDC